MNVIDLKLRLPFKRLTAEEERKRIARLTDKELVDHPKESVELFSPYTGVTIVVDGLEMPQPIAIAAINVRPLSEKEISALGTDFWQDAKKFEDPRSGRKDYVKNVEYKSKEVCFLWKNEETQDVYHCDIPIDLPIG